MSIYSQPAQNDEDIFIVESPLEILSLLRALQRSNALLKMQAEGSTASIITTILDIDRKRGQMTLDNAKDASINDRLTRAEHIRFDTRLDKIQISFNAPSAEECEFDGYPALRFALPGSVRRIQRREFYRIEPPVTEPAHALIPLLDAKGRVEKLAFTIKDISTGGIAVYDPDLRLKEPKGMLYKGCLLQLPDIGELSVDLCIERYTEEASNDKTVGVAGLSLFQPSSAVSLRVQHYIGVLERKFLARRRGF